MALLRVDEVMHQRNVVPAAFQRDARMGEEVRLQLEVVAVFVNGSVLEDLPDGVQPVPWDGTGLVIAAEDDPFDGGEDALGIGLGNETAAALCTDGLDHLGGCYVVDNEFLPFMCGRRRPHMRDEALE